DWLRADEAVERFLAAADTEVVDGDVVTGRAGHLVACACLLEAVRAAGFEERQLLEFGARRQAEVLADLSGRPAGANGKHAFLGIAHGWAGLAYAALRFGAVALEPPSPEVVATLDALGGHALRDGRRAWWPREPGGDEVWPGWCHG